MNNKIPSRTRPAFWRLTAVFSPVSHRLGVDPGGRFCDGPYPFRREEFTAATIDGMASIPRAQVSARSTIASSKDVPRTLERFFLSNEGSSEAPQLEQKDTVGGAMDVENKRRASAKFKTIFITGIYKTRRRTQPKLSWQSFHPQWST